MSRFVSGNAERWGLDTIGAVGALAFAVLLLPLEFTVANVYVRTIPIVVGLAGATYLFSKRTRSTGERVHWRLSAGLGHAVGMAVVVGIAGLVLVGTLTGGRTVPFFALAAIVGGLIFVQILFQEEPAIEPTFVLAQLVAFAFVVRGMALYTTPGTIGVDSWVHLPTYAAAIRETGGLAAIADSKYFGAPLYHLLVVVAADAFNTTLRTGLYATLGVVVPLAGLLVYYTTREFLPVRWGLFATACFLMADQVIRWGLHLIPTSMGLVFFLGAFYGVGKIFVNRRPRAAYALLVFFTVALVFTHQISTFILLVFLGAGALLQVVRVLVPGARFEGDLETVDAHVNFLGVFLFAAALTLANWWLSPPEGPSFLAEMIASVSTRIESAGFLELNSLLKSSTIRSNPAVDAMVTEVPMAWQVIDVSGFLLLLFVTLVGSFFLLQERLRELLSVAWVSSTAVMLFVVLGMPMFGLYFFIPGRWYAFVYVPMVVLGAFGMWALERGLTARGFVIAVLLFALIFPGAMLVNNKATHDRPVRDDYYHRFAFSESELAAADTIAEIHPSDEMLRADSPYYLYLRNAETVGTGPLVVSESGAFTGDHVIYRDYQARGGTQARFAETMIRVQPTAEQVCRPSMDVLYTNGDVRYCRSTAP